MPRYQNATTTRFVAAIFVSVLIIVGWQLFMPPPSRYSCAVDQDRTIEQMLSRRDGERTVPKGFVVERGPFNWSVVDRARQYVLPSRAAASVLLGREYSGTGYCRVRDPSGKWWVVTGRDRGGILSYVAQDDLALTNKTP